MDANMVEVRRVDPTLLPTVANLKYAGSDATAKLTLPEVEERKDNCRQFILDSVRIPLC